RALLRREENRGCADCTAQNPTWAGVSHGVFLCTQCSGALGVHISQVLSCQLDDWTEDQVSFMAGVGNSLANAFLEYHVPEKWPKPSHLEPRDYRESYIKAYQLFVFRVCKKPVIKPPPPVEEDEDTLEVGDVPFRCRAGSSPTISPSGEGMVEYIGFINIDLSRARDLLPMKIKHNQYMAVLRIGKQEIRSRWAKSGTNPVWNERLMLCWDGSMPLTIDVYGGMEHIGQAYVPLRELVLEE
ncbi:unnamed protein product, partial [Discosporangium mesarthrocarpum]